MRLDREVREALERQAQEKLAAAVSDSETHNSNLSQLPGTNDSSILFAHHIGLGKLLEQTGAPREQRGG